MNDGISRRDFLNGVALLVGAGMMPACGRPHSPAGTPSSSDKFLGSTPAALADAHALRDGAKFDLRPLPIDETVDLVVIGSGISGLSAAHAFRKRNPNARILILDNHDDFGGHARRCEMRVDGRLLLTYGGSESIQSPHVVWSEGALGLLTELGVDLKRFETAFDRGLYPGLGLSRGLLFNRENFGVDKLVTGDPMRMVADDIPADKLNARTPADFVAQFPLPGASREKLVALYTSPRDVLAGKTLEQKQALLQSTSYRDFLTKHWGLDEAGANVFQRRSCDFFAAGIDGVPAWDAGLIGYPGFQGLGLPKDEEAQKEMDEPYIHHFPDGNASIARLLVRRLMPAVAPGNTMEDVVGAHFDYDKLDVNGAPTRLRLKSTAVKVANIPGGLVDIGYMHAGKLRRVQAKNAIHAGYNMMLPYMMPELAKPQFDALHAGVKAPLVYAKIAVRNWEPWAKLGLHEATNPMGFFSRIKLDYPVSLGDYKFAKSPKEPTCIHMVHTPTPSGMPDQRTAWRAGRGILFGTTYEQFEEKIFDELKRLLGPGGFEPKRDIAAISLYRWGHGYAYGFNSLYDKPQQPEVPVIAHQRVGRVAIANSDAGWSAYANSAMDQAARAVDELATGS
jgi:spermidine dehydrogenase